MSYCGTSVGDCWGLERERASDGGELSVAALQQLTGMEKGKAERGFTGTKKKPEDMKEARQRERGTLTKDGKSWR